MTIRIFLADSHQIFREGLLHLLNREEDMSVVGEAGDGESAARLVKKLSPDAVVMDVDLPVMTGIEAARIITRESVKVIALSSLADHYHIAEMMQAGASGYILKDCALKELLTAIRAVFSGETYLSPEITGIVVTQYLSSLGSNGSHQSSSITKREREVLKLIAEGLCTRDIASKLKVSVKTIETHRRQVMEKLGLYSIAELTKYAIREGLTYL